MVFSFPNVLLSEHFQAFIFFERGGGKELVGVIRIGGKIGCSLFLVCTRQIRQVN